MRGDGVYAPFHCHHVQRPRLRGFFLCAELDQTVFTMAFNQLGSDPVQTPGNLATVVGVLVTVESFEQEHPLIRAEVNGFSGRRFCHEWTACDFLEWSVL